MALNLLHMNFMNAKARAWQKWTEHAKNKMRKNFDKSTRTNIKDLSNMKGKVEFLEEKNYELAAENDKLRLTAKESLQLIENAASLQNDIEKMSLQLADKATTIRKLIEDNTKLAKLIK